MRKDAPVVIVLHGGTQSMREIFEGKAGGSRAWLNLAREHDFLLVAPNGYNPKRKNGKGNRQMWNDYRLPGSRLNSEMDDVAFIRKLVRRITRQYGVDDHRIYVTGASNGGMMTYRLLIESPGLFAAAAAFITSLPVDHPDLRPPSKPTPLLIANGTEDPLVKWEGGSTVLRKGHFMPVEEHVAWWVRANKAQLNRSQKSLLPDFVPEDNCRITRQFFPAQDKGAPVVFYKIQGGGHAIPSIKYSPAKQSFVKRLIGPVCRDAEGAELAWRFMRKFSNSE